MQRNSMYICEEPPAYSEFDPNQQLAGIEEPTDSTSLTGESDATFTKLSAEINERLLNKYLPLYRGYQEIGHRVIHGEIEDWSKVDREGVCAKFNISDNQFQLVIYPVDEEVGGFVSLYLECMYSEHTKDHPHICVYFCLALSNPADPSVCWRQAFEHRFTYGSNLHGSGRFIERRALKSILDGHSRPILEHGRVRVSAFVRVIYDETGIMWGEGLRKRSLYPITRCAGIRLHPDYPYLGMLLQTLYHMKAVRHSIYLAPTHGLAPTRSVICAIKRVFLNLETSTTFVHIGELVRALRHEAGEMCTALNHQQFDSLVHKYVADALHNTVATGITRKLFRGRVRTSVCTPDAQLRAVDVEDLYTLQLTVRGCLNLRESFEDFCRPRVLDSSCLHSGQQRGRLSAYKTSSFDSLPPVLHIYLDSPPGSQAKGHSGNADPYEYPPAIDLGQYITGPDSSSTTWRYAAYGVYLWSQTSTTCGYTFYLCPGKPNRWVEFAGDTVAPERQYNVFASCLVADPVSIVRKSSKAPYAKQGNVCGLVYIREDLRELILRSGDIHRLHSILSH